MPNNLMEAIHDVALARGCAYYTETTPGGAEDGRAENRDAVPDGAENGGAVNRDAVPDGAPNADTTPVSAASGESYQGGAPNMKTVTRYSLRALTVTEENGETRAVIKTPFVGLKRLFIETDDQTVRELLFNSIRECTHCISDKCTSLLMAPARTLSLGGRSKKSCSMWGQWVSMPVNGANLTSCIRIIDRFLSEAEAAGESHADVCKNDITYHIASKGGFYVAGYRHKHTAISAGDDEVVESLLPKMPELCASLGVSDDGRYVGATADFINGSQYDFIFGVMLDSKPDAAALPEGAAVRRIRAGEWAVYNSSLADYPSVWRHYADHFYELEKRGWDSSRIPFEIYGRDGGWRDLHIPVDAGAPADAGKVALWEYRPDFEVAGWERVGEEDHPDWFDNAGVEKRVRELQKTPGAEWFGYSLHQYYGKPMRFSSFIVVNDTLDIPGDFMRRNIKGGLWRINAWRHFNGGSGEGCWDMDEPYKQPFEKQSLCLDHPRVFATKCYDARGGYDETWIPMRFRGEYTFEILSLPPMRMYAKPENPLNGKTVPDEELRTYYSLAGSAAPGSLVVGYKPAFFENNVMLYAAPLIKGVPAADGDEAPDGFGEYTLDGGLFVKITEVNPDGSPYPRGEPGWDVEFISFPNAEAPGIAHSTDFSRHCRMVQTGYGKYYELYVPVK